jgi:hypothetical protein
MKECNRMLQYNITIITVAAAVVKTLADAFVNNVKSIFNITF